MATKCPDVAVHACDACSVSVHLHMHEDTFSLGAAQLVLLAYLDLQSSSSWINTFKIKRVLNLRVLSKYYLTLL